MFLLLFLPAICRAGQEADNAANLILQLYGDALRTNNISGLELLLDEKYELHPCDKTLKPLNREKIIETAKFLPQHTIKLSKRTLGDAGIFPNNMVRLKVNLGGYTNTVIEATLKTKGWVISYEQQNDCDGRIDLATTYMIDYNETAYHTGRVLLGTLVGWSRSEENKLLIDAMHFPFQLSYYHKDAMDTPKTLSLSMEEVKESRIDYDKKVLPAVVRVVDAVLWPNRSVTFETTSGQFNHKSSFIASPFLNSLSGVKWERHVLTLQFVHETLAYNPVDLNFLQLQYWDIEK